LNKIFGSHAVAHPGKGLAVETISVKINPLPGVHVVVLIHGLIHGFEPGKSLKRIRLSPYLPFKEDEVK